MENTGRNSSRVTLPVFLCLLADNQILIGRAQRDHDIMLVSHNFCYILMCEIIYLTNASFEVLPMKMEAVSEKLGLPKDLLLGAAIITLTGQNEAYIENHRGIIEYTDKLLKIQTKTCKILITGEALTIEYYTNDELKLNGRFSDIKYY